jgi:hypothetical protein
MFLTLPCRGFPSGSGCGSGCDGGARRGCGSCWGSCSGSRPGRPAVGKMVRLRRAGMRQRASAVDDECLDHDGEGLRGGDEGRVLVLDARGEAMTAPRRGGHGRRASDLEDGEERVLHVPGGGSSAWPSRWGVERP